MFFTLDNVLYNGNLAFDIAKRVARGVRTLRAIGALSRSVIGYRSGISTMDELVRAASGIFAGQPAAEVMAEACRAAGSLRHNLNPVALSVLERFQAQGVPIVIFSLAPTETIHALLEPLAFTAFGSAVEVENGLISQNVKLPLPYAGGKLLLAESFLARRSLQISQTAFYGASSADEPLLASVGIPFCVNGSKRLARIAKERGWMMYKV